MLESTPRGAMLLMAGGLPCQQLAAIGQHAGQLGLRGRDSVNFFIFPALAWMIQRRRPDLHIHVLVENAGTMVEVHTEGMARAGNPSERRACARDRCRKVGSLPETEDIS